MKNKTKDPATANSARIELAAENNVDEAASTNAKDLAIAFYSHSIISCR